MDPIRERSREITRRTLLAQGARGLGAIALATMLRRDGLAAAPGSAPAAGGLPELPHFTPKAKRVIYLFMAGGPSHIDTFDYKPALRDIHGQELPESIRQGQRLTTMTSGQTSFPCVAPMFDFQRYGQHGTWVSELLPYTAQIVDDITIVKTMNTEAINHDPAITFITTGEQQPGRPSLGAWLSYGLGAMNRDLPSYVVMISRGSGNLQALYARLWGSGFLPSKHQGVKFRSGDDPVLYLGNPDGIDATTRRRMLDGIAEINAAKHEETGDPEINDRIAQYEMAYRMQSSVPELTDLRDEPDWVFDMYGPDSRKPGTFAANCILARRLAERNVRFVQLFHRGWDGHNNLPREIRGQCKDTDQPAAALVQRSEGSGACSKIRVVIFGGEFGRTIYSPGQTDQG